MLRYTSSPNIVNKFQNVTKVLFNNEFGNFLLSPKISNKMISGFNSAKGKIRGSSSISETTAKWTSGISADSVATGHAETVGEAVLSPIFDKSNFFKTLRNKASEEMQRKLANYFHKQLKDYRNEMDTNPEGFKAYIFKKAGSVTEMAPLLMAFLTLPFKWDNVKEVNHPKRKELVARMEEIEKKSPLGFNGVLIYRINKVLDDVDADLSQEALDAIVNQIERLQELIEKGVKPYSNEYKEARFLGEKEIAKAFLNDEAYAGSAAHWGNAIFGTEFAANATSMGDFIENVTGYQPNYKDAEKLFHDGPLKAISDKINPPTISQSFSNARKFQKGIISALDEPTFGLTNR